MQHCLANTITILLLHVFTEVDAVSDVDVPVAQVLIMYVLIDVVHGRWEAFCPIPQTWDHGITSECDSRT